MNPVLARFLQTLAPERVTMLRGQEQGLAALLEQLCGDDTRLAEALAARLPEGDVIDGLRQIRADDVRLVCAATDGDPEALTRVDTLLAAEVNAAAASVRAQAGLADEVKQRLREQLLVGNAEDGPGIAEYAGRGDLRGFLRITAVRECLRLMKRLRREVGMDGDDLSLHVPAVDPELERLKATYRGEFADCFAAALRSLDARERTLLRMHAIDRLGIDQLSVLYGVHRSTAARWLERARATVAERTEQLLAERLTLSTTEVASVIRLVRSELDISLERLLR
ncbi:MAG TPA: sigma factor-like helix-turn-helix DNA-binding protein [Polyangia bacterium]|nr:sigma factor-like helix-turn-helix DNA-binding protein [Polyangia bacterium]